MKKVEYKDTEIEFYGKDTPSPQQRAFHNDKHRYTLIGGAKYGGKSKAICWEAFRLCMKYPGNYGFMGRKRGSDFKTSTLRTFFREIPNSLFEHKKQEHRILFPNGSEIFYGGLDDRELIEKFNSLEAGFFCIDQAEEISPDDWTALAGTLRFKLPDGTSPQYRGILSCNPRNCWLKDKFILRPDKDYHFIQALPASNPSEGAEEYINSLKDLYKNKPRLLRAYIYGSWDDLEATNTLIPYKAVSLAVNKELTKKPFKEPIIIACDPARMGDDETVIYVFKGLTMIKEKEYGKVRTMETVGNIVTLFKKYKANIIIVDNVIHTGVVDRLMELEYPVVGFVGAEQASDPIKYKEGKIKMEMWDMVLEKFTEGEISIFDDAVLKGQLSSMTYEVASDSGQKMTSKKDMKKILGNSPDRADCLALAVFCYGTYIDWDDYTEEEPPLRETTSTSRTGYG